MFDADERGSQKSNFNGNLDISKTKTVFFIIGNANKSILDFSQGTFTAL